jgi:hypothetical protein
VVTTGVEAALAPTAATGTTLPLTGSNNGPLLVLAFTILALGGLMVLCSQPKSTEPKGNEQ